MDEVGLLHQPQPDGSSSVYEDLQSTRHCMGRQQEKGIDVTQGRLMSGLTLLQFMKLLSTAPISSVIFKTRKRTRSSNYTARTGPNGIKFTRSTVSLFSILVPLLRLMLLTVCTKQRRDVWIRDFLPTFLLVLQKVSRLA